MLLWYSHLFPPAFEYSQQYHFFFNSALAGEPPFMYSRTKNMPNRYGPGNLREDWWCDEYSNNDSSARDMPGRRRPYPGRNERYGEASFNRHSTFDPSRRPSRRSTVISTEYCYREENIAGYGHRDDDFREADFENEDRDLGNWPFRDRFHNRQCHRPLHFPSSHLPRVSSRTYPPQSQNSHREHHRPQREGTYRHSPSPHRYRTFSRTSTTQNHDPRQKNNFQRAQTSYSFRFRDSDPSPPRFQHQERPRNGGREEGGTAAPAGEKRADMYGVLGLEPGCTIDDIKKAYRKLSLKHHPDRNLGDNAATAKFQAISQAYESLINDK